MTTHIPVMVDEILSALQPRDGGKYIDGTFGNGGHGTALLEAANCKVWGVDRDPDAISRADRLIDQYTGRLVLVEGRFGDLETVFADAAPCRVDGITLDLGVSSMQLEDPERGFSFRLDGPLDMRQERRGESAETLVNGASEAVLSDIIYRYGEEPQARRIARAIVDYRARNHISTTGQLAEIVRNAKRGPGRGRTDPATRTFQAFRIRVNRELEELQRGLRAAETVLSPGGRLAVISFHSLEDRLVKNFFRERSARSTGGSRHLPPAAPTRPRATFREFHRGAMKPSSREIEHNPRARSARLRIVERVPVQDRSQRQ